MNNKKHIVNLEYLREMLQICPKLPDQQFEEPPFEEEILTFLKDLGHSGEIKVITDVDVNKLHQPWRSFVVVINKCLSGKSTGYDSLRLSQAQILWGMYHKKNVDYATSCGVLCYIKHEDTQLYGAILPDELTNEAIKYSESYKEYYAIALGAEPPKTKPSVKKKQVGSDKTKTPPTAKGKRLKTLAKAVKPTKKKQPTKTSKAKGLSVLSDVALTESEQMKLATKRSLIQTHNSHTINSGADEGTGGTPGVPDVPTYESDEEQISWKSSDKENDDDDNDDDEDNEIERQDDVDDDADNQDDEGQEGDEENDDDDNDNDEDNDDDDENDDVDDDADNQDDEGQDDDNKKTDLEKDGDEFVHPKFSTHDQEERQDEEDNEEEGLDLRVQTPSYYESTNDEESDEVTHTSRAVAANLSELELKKILIDKMESNKSIHRSDEQKNLYKVLVDAYESDKLILDTYGDTVLLKGRRDDEDKDEESSTGSNRGSKRKRAGKEPESTSAPKEKTSKTIGKSTEGSKSHHKFADKSAQGEEPMHTIEDLEEPAHQEFDTRFSEDQPVNETTQHHDCSLDRKEDTRDSFNELMDTPLDFLAFLMNRLKVDTLTPKLLAGLIFELMKGVVPQSRTLNVNAVTKTKAADYGHVKWIEDLVPNTMWSPMPVIYDKYALWGISHWGQKRQNDDKLYTFKEGDYKRLRLQDIEDMLLLLVQGKLTNLTIEERLALNVIVNVYKKHYHTKACGRSSVRISRKIVTLAFIHQEQYEHVCPKVTSSQDGKVYKMAKRDYAGNGGCENVKMVEHRDDSTTLEG
ncbi:hypothetical protein Tco_1244362 [Tanacetum coccineum]